MVLVRGSGQGLAPQVLGMRGQVPRGALCVQDPAAPGSRSRQKGDEEESRGCPGEAER